MQPDGVILGKALGGGLLPVSMFVATDDVMQVFTPGDHGSTFGGNPLASAVALAALDVLEGEGLCARSASLGRVASGASCARSTSPLITDVRGRGLFIGIEVDTRQVTARACRRPAARARHPVEGHARHGGAHRAAARHRARGSRVGGGRDRARAISRSSDAA